MRRAHDIKAVESNYSHHTSLAIVFVFYCYDEYLIIFGRIWPALSHQGIRIGCFKLNDGL